jgi:hypothetical protein
MQWKTITATVMRKGNDGADGRRYLIVRSSALDCDKVVSVSQEDYDRLDASMLVTMRQVGWGAFSTWRLRHAAH